MVSLKVILAGADPVAVLSRMDVEGTLGSLEPSLADLRMRIPAGYHHKDNLTHSIAVLGNAIVREPNGPDLILRTAALFHDVGKPATRKFGKRGLVTFEGHEAVGARMVKGILRKHGYTPAEVRAVARLVAYHMRSHGFSDDLWTDSAVRRLTADIGDQVNLERLIVLFYADVTTKHAHKRAVHHGSVDALVAAIERVRVLDARASLRPAIDGNYVMDRYGLTPGRELGQIMRFLNSDEGIMLSEAEANQAIQDRFGLRG